MTQIKRVTVEISSGSPEPVTSRRPSPANAVSVFDLTIFSCFGFVAALSGIIWAVTKHKKDPLKTQPQSPQDDIPCRNCKFFNNNQYLKCTVHPLVVFTKDAINCSDYCSSQKKKVRWTESIGQY
jgi:hypothetical protein